MIRPPTLSDNITCSIRDWNAYLEAEKAGEKFLRRSQFARTRTRSNLNPGHDRDAEAVRLREPSQQLHRALLPAQVTD